MSVMEKLFKDEEIYTPIEIAEKLKISKEAVYAYIKSGKLPAYRIGKFWRVKGKDMNKFVEVVNADKKQ